MSPSADSQSFSSSATGKRASQGLTDTTKIRNVDRSDHEVDAEAEDD